MHNDGATNAFVHSMVRGLSSRGVRFVEDHAPTLWISTASHVFTPQCGDIAFRLHPSNAPLQENELDCSAMMELTTKMLDHLALQLYRARFRVSNKIVHGLE